MAVNTSLLRDHIKNYLSKLRDEKVKHEDDLKERAKRKAYYSSWIAQRILSMTKDDLYDYMSQLWAMRLWSNKRYVVEKMVEENTLEGLKQELSNLVWGPESVGTRWDRFRSKVSQVGPAMMSEILCHVHPDSCMLWNRRAYVAFRYLEVDGLPRYDYQLTGAKYEELSRDAQQIAREMGSQGVKEVDLLVVDYFIWDELQVEDTLSQMHRRDRKDIEGLPKVEELDSTTSQFVHNEIRDKLAEIGRWLGFQTDIERKVAEGSVVDTVWEATIGNMGRVIYVFEVQTKGSIDSLVLNLLKSMNNAAVQGVVAVSDATQLEKIKRQVSSVRALADKARYWNYEEVVKVHEALQSVNEAINRLGLVPESF
jgi:hypothetical protein